MIGQEVSKEKEKEKTKEKKEKKEKKDKEKDKEKDKAKDKDKEVKDKEVKDKKEKNSKEKEKDKQAKEKKDKGDKDKAVASSVAADKAKLPVQVPPAGAVKKKDEEDGEEAAFWALLDDDADPELQAGRGTGGEEAAPAPAELPSAPAPADQASVAGPAGAAAGFQAANPTATQAVEAASGVESSLPMDEEEPEDDSDPFTPGSLKLSLSEVGLLKSEGKRWFNRAESFADGVVLTLIAPPPMSAPSAKHEVSIEGDDAQATLRAVMCLRGAVASLQNEYIEARDLPDEEEGHSVALDIPAEAGVVFHPKSLMESFDVIAFVVREKDAQDHSLSALKSKDAKTLSRQLGFAMGQMVEVRYDDIWYLGEVTGFTEAREVIVQWQGGGEAAMPVADVRPSSLKPTAAAVSKRALDGKPGGRLLIFGPQRARTAAQLSVMAAVERILPGLFSESDKQPKQPAAMFEFGVQMLKLEDSKHLEAASKHRSRVAAASEAVLEVIGRFAAVAGEPEERSRAEHMVTKILPSMGPLGNALELATEGLEDWVSLLRVPQLAERQLAGQDMDRIQDETGTFCAWLPPNTTPPARDVPGTVEVGGIAMEADAAVQVKYEGAWHSATVLDRGTEAGTVLVCWDFDGTEMEVPAKDIRASTKEDKQRQLWLSAPRVLVIIGPERCRRACALRVMAASERTCPGLWSRSNSSCITELLDGAEEMDVMLGIEMTSVTETEEELAWAKSPAGQGSLRRAAAASGCVMEHIGSQAILVGFPNERELCKEYVRWTILARMEGEARLGKLSVPDADMREDISIQPATESEAANLRPDRLWPVEVETSTIVLVDDGGESALASSMRRLLICGQSAASRETAKRKVAAMISGSAVYSKVLAKRPTAEEEPRENKRPRVAAGGSEDASQSSAWKSDPKEVLNRIGFPQSINEWGTKNTTIWEGHSKLPKGWIRIWSRSQDCEYYLRVRDNKTTFHLDDLPLIDGNG
mmetsp:Transcript_70173/g.168183  ORF Transcript_70173/g.168183 Transcript_70173/m.168183 type:complete len:984 (+) Transcript_70173:109-3060(+)